MTYAFGEVTTLTYEHETALRDKLTVLLGGLIVSTTSKDTVEYGDPTQLPGSHLSFVRIRWMPTFGIKQFRICELYLGTEGGGAYHPSVASAVNWAMLLVRHYHRPNPIRDRFKPAGRKRPDLDWFAFDSRKGMALPLRAMMNERTVEEQVPSETVTLKPEGA